MKDSRKVIKNKKVEANGIVAYIDGKFDEKKNSLKIYRYRGDIGIAQEAIQNYAIVNNIREVVLKF